jgi:hypothetical protein
VNGVAATTSYDSGLNKTSWSASGIPGNEDGWMELVATAVPSGSSAPITAKLEFEKPPLLRLKEYHWEKTITIDGFWGIPEPLHEERHYKRKVGGYYTGTVWENGYTCTSHFEWTPGDVFTNYSKVCEGSTNTTGYWEAPPGVFRELAEASQSTNDGGNYYTFEYSMNQSGQLRASGQTYPGLKRVVAYHAPASTNDFDFNNDVTGWFFDGVSSPVPPTLLALNGAALDNDANSFAVVQSGSKSEVIIKSMQPVAPKLGFGISVSNTMVSIEFKNTGTLTHRETNGNDGKVYGYAANLYDYVITNFTGTNRLGADNPPLRSFWFNFADLTAVVPTNRAFDTG